MTKPRERTIRERLPSLHAVVGGIACAAIVVAIGIASRKSYFSDQLRRLIPTADSQPGISDVDKAYFLATATENGVELSQAIVGAETQDFLEYTTKQVKDIVTAYRTAQQRRRDTARLDR